MLNLNQSKNRLAVVGVTLAGLAFAGNANAATENVEAEVEFVAPVTITETRALQYGLLDVNMVNPETIVIAPDNGQSGTGLGRIVGGVQNAALLTVTATNAQPITVLIDTVVDGAYYALSTFRCDYDGGADADCDVAFDIGSAVPSAVLRVGATLTAAGGASVGQDFGSFDVTVTYQ